MKYILILLIFVTIGISQSTSTSLAIKSHELGTLHYKLAMAQWLMENDYDCLANLNWTEIDSLLSIHSSKYYEIIRSIE